MPYTDEELAGLTDDERAALLDDEEEQEEQGDQDEADAADEADHEEGEEGDENQGDDGESDDQDGADDGATDDDGADDGEPEPEPQRADVRQQAPILVVEAPADADGRLQQIADEKAALIEKFDDGELTAKEYQQQLDALSKQEREIEWQIERAKLAADMEAQRLANERDAQIAAFLHEHKIKNDPEDPSYKALNAAVIAVANIPDSADKSVREILQEAYDFCVFRKQIAPPAGKEQQPAPAARQRRPIDAPPTLARVPAADMTDTDEGNRFAYLDRLDPVARERAFAQLSPADQEAYLAS